MKKNVKNYNGVEIEKSWSLVSFAKINGKPKLAPCVNHDTGEEFTSLVFDKEDGSDLTWCHFGYSTQGMSGREIVRNIDKLKVGLTTSGKYTLYQQGEGAWEELDINL